MGTPSAGWDLLVRETAESARRRRRRKRQRRARRMLWLLTCVTTGVLAAIALFVLHISKVPTMTRPTALTLSQGSTSAADRASPKHAHRPVITQPQVTDVTSGLSYQQLSSPWRSGCPSDLITPTFNWSAGENTMAGHVTIGGSVVDWHGVACSGQLQQQFSYASPADLEPTAMNLLGALDPAYYAGVPHSRTIDKSSAMRVSGHQAWIVKFTMHYQDGASQGLTWSTEPGAVVVVDRGSTEAPAVFYVSVPANLGTQKVATLLGSLRLSAQS